MPRLSSEQRQLLEQLTTSYAENLEIALPYLASRGISRELAERFQLGVVVDEDPSDARLRGRLSIPYLRRDTVVDIRYRHLPRDLPDTGQEAPTKYLGRTGSTTHLFNTEALFGRHDRIAIAEGELDCIVLDGTGIPAVGVPGVKNWKAHYDNLLEDFQRIVVFGDGDGPGRDFAAERVASNGASAVRLSNDPNVNDVTDAFLAYGPDYLRRLFENA
jgi:DNA primase